MPFSSTFTLTAGSSSNVGPFSIVGEPGSVSVATGVTRGQLLTGMTYHNIDNSVTGFTITSSGTCTNSITVSTTASPTPTPTPTPTATSGGQGLCYRYEVSNTVNQDSYGVRYTDPNVGTSQDVKFNMLPAEDGGSYAIFNICSTVDPTLLDYTGGSPIGVGSVSGVARFGGITSCSSSFDCTTPTTTYCYTNALAVVVGPFSTLQECQNAAGSYICSACVGEPEP